MASGTEVATSYPSCAYEPPPGGQQWPWSQNDCRLCHWGPLHGALPGLGFICCLGSWLCPFPSSEPPALSSTCPQDHSSLFKFRVLLEGGDPVRFHTPVVEAQSLLTVLRPRHGEGGSVVKWLDHRLWTTLVLSLDSATSSL